MKLSVRSVALWFVAGVVGTLLLCWVAAYNIYTIREATQQSFVYGSNNQGWAVRESESWCMSSVDSGSIRNGPYASQENTFRKPTHGWSRPARVPIEEHDSFRAGLFPRSKTWISEAELQSKDNWQTMHEVAWGWPMRAWVSTTVSDNSAENMIDDGNFTLSFWHGFRRILPLRPLLGGVLVDGVILGATLWGMTLVASTIRLRLRRAHWLQTRCCPTCGYDNSGVKSSLCPECGKDPRVALRLLQT